MNNLLRRSLLTLLIAAPLVLAIPASAKPRQEIKLFLVSVGGKDTSGRKFGCGDTLVSVTHTIQPTSAPLTAAIQSLLKEPHHSKALPGLENFWVGSELALKSVAVRSGTATIRFNGHVAVAGICDEPRIKEQIEATARQFPGVRRVKVYIGSESLADAIS